ncbi:hypothetical protein ACE1SV_64190 [Streptomyces sp. E-15]
MPGQWKTHGQGCDLRQGKRRRYVLASGLGLVYAAFIAALIALLKSTVLVVVIAAGLLGVQYPDRPVCRARPPRHVRSLGLVSVVVRVGRAGPGVGVTGLGSGCLRVGRLLS